MNMKKIFAGITAFLCCTGILAYMPEMTQEIHAANYYIFEDSFENGTADWNSRGTVAISTSSQTAFAGSESLLAEGRTAAWNGAFKTLNPNLFLPGVEYSFSVAVNYFEGGNTDLFCLKLQYQDAAGQTQYASIAEAEVRKGEWTQLANTNYQLPAGASEMQIYVETTETTNSFYIDEAVGAAAGTVVQETLEPAISGVPGDVNSDGVINIYDLILAKHYLTQNTAPIEADVDKNGEFQVKDVIQIQKYLVTSSPA